MDLPFSLLSISNEYDELNIFVGRKLFDKTFKAKLKHR